METNFYLNNLKSSNTSALDRTESLPHLILTRNENLELVYKENFCFCYLQPVEAVEKHGAETAAVPIRSSFFREHLDLQALTDAGFYKIDLLLSG